MGSISFRELIGIAIATCVTLGLPVQTVQAQDAAQARRYSLVLEGLSLQDALNRIVIETGLNLVYESELVRGRTTRCSTGPASAEDLLECILKGTDIGFSRLPSGTYVLVLRPAARAPSGSVSGRVLDEGSGRPISGANVSIGSVGTATGVAGEFMLTSIAAGSHHLVVSHVAYLDRTDTIRVKEAQNDTLTVFMEQRVISFLPIVITDEDPRQHSAFMEGSNVGNRINPRLSLAGTVDLVRSLGTVSGVTVGNARSDMHVQGGSIDEQQFLLDGTPIYMPTSNGGIIGPFSSLATGSIVVRKAGFGAMAGSSLSGAVEFEQLIDNPNVHRGAVQVDPMSLNLRLQGRVAVGNSTSADWMVSARSSLWGIYRPAALHSVLKSWAAPDLFLLSAIENPGIRPIRPQGENASAGDAKISYQDVHLATRIRFSPLRSLRLSAYGSSNNFGIVGAIDSRIQQESRFDDEYVWTNRMMSARYEWVHHDRLMSTIGLSHSRYQLRHPFIPADVPLATFDEYNELGETRLTAQTWASIGEVHEVSAGLEAMLRVNNTLFSVDPFGSRSSSSTAIQPSKWVGAVFAQDRIGLSEPMTLTLGGRLSWLPTRSAVFVEPRVALQYDVVHSGLPELTFRIAAGVYRQYTTSFDSATYSVRSLLPRVRFWLPIPADQPIPLAYHTSFSAIARMNSSFQTGLEAYFKYQPRLVALQYTDRQQGSLFQQASGHAFGVAWSGSLDAGPLTIDSRYEFGVSRRTGLPGVVDKLVMVPWAVPHQVSTDLEVALSDHVSFSIGYYAATGRSWGFRPVYYEYLAPHLEEDALHPVELTDPERHVLPAFSQWDVGLQVERPFRAARVHLEVSLVNATNRANVTEWSLQYDERTGSYARMPHLSVPRFASASLMVSF